jgi:hypothetical protein
MHVSLEMRTHKLFDYSHKRIEYLSVRSNYFFIEEISVPAIEVRNLASRLFKDERAGCHIPGIQSVFKKNIKPSASRITKVNGS